MRRLYLKIYLAFLATVVFAVVVTAWVGSAIHTGPRDISASLSALATRAVGDLSTGPALPSALAARADELKLRLSLWGADGTHLASSHAPIRGPADTAFEASWSAGRMPSIVVPLADGRWLSAATQVEHTPGTFLLVLLVLLLAIALGIYPLSKRITRRLEAVGASVQAFGEGDLNARAVIKGKDEVAQLARDFNATADRIGALIGAQRRVLAHASHELRSPLARLRMVVELMADAEQPEVRQQHLAAAERDVAELDRLIEDVLLRSRLEAGAHGLAPATVDLGAVFAAEAAAVGATVSGAAAPVSADARLVQRVARNLLTNAARHGAAPITVVVTDRGDDGVQIVVDDAGVGVPAADRERVFEPFYRAQGRAHDGTGVGLGLALVAEIVALHGGTIRCAGAPGGGARFDLRLPRQGVSPNELPQH